MHLGCPATAQAAGALPPLLPLLLLYCDGHCIATAAATARHALLELALLHYFCGNYDDAWLDLALILEQQRQQQARHGGGGSSSSAGGVQLAWPGGADAAEAMTKAGAQGAAHGQRFGSSNCSPIVDGEVSGIHRSHPAEEGGPSEHVSSREETLSGGSSGAHSTHPSDEGTPSTHPSDARTPSTRPAEEGGSGGIRAGCSSGCSSSSSHSTSLPYKGGGGSGGPRSRSGPPADESPSSFVSPTAPVDDEEEGRPSGGPGASSSLSVMSSRHSGSLAAAATTMDVLAVAATDVLGPDDLVKAVVLLEKIRLHLDFSVAPPPLSLSDS